MQNILKNPSKCSICILVMDFERIFDVAFFSFNLAPARCAVSPDEPRGSNFLFDFYVFFERPPPVHSPRWRLATSSLTICPSSIFLILLRFQLRILTKIRGSHENHVRAANCKFVIKGQKSKDN